MISSFPSYDEELLNSAYANISLIADKAWTFDAGNPFRKLNRSLWIQNCKLTAKYKENGSYRPRRVRDVIPDSRLATYDDYEYNEEHEGPYRQHDNATSVPQPNFCWTEVTEPWMLPEVEERFAWLIAGGARANREFSAVRLPDPEDLSNTGHGFEMRWEDSAQSQRNTRMSSPMRKSHESRTESRLTKETNLIEPDPDQKFVCYGHRRYTIENPMEMQLHVRVTSEAVRNLWKSGTSQQQFPQQRMSSHQTATNQREQSWQSKDRQQQFYYTLQYRPLILRTEYQAARTETYGIPRKHLSPVLSPEVPEFFPKVPLTRFTGNKEQTNNRMRYFPSLNERSYQNELFPYNRTHENAGALYQVISNAFTGCTLTVFDIAAHTNNYQTCSDSRYPAWCYDFPPRKHKVGNYVLVGAKKKHFFNHFSF
ncbi:uncharacterized protein LOC128893289 [Hylaeus anthracinus]|uniref:uncharacterized protein LOC128893287 n=1 Tax=Hylaeus anthracinus TaxID=313031 RepID=UPI0023B95214|nr:uncharacterized protein LOC128893287 [Hylaeus anthracinus]XP_054010118.1 uncharacterized protein LOC128893289 [Hylaeus anthracinus]